MWFNHIMCSKFKQSALLESHTTYIYLLFLSPFTLAAPRIYFSPNFKQELQLSFSHRKSLPLRLIEGVLVVRFEFFDSATWFSFSPSFSLIWACCIHRLIWICYSFNLVFLDVEAVWEFLDLPWPLWSAWVGLGLKKTRPFVGSLAGSRTHMWCDRNSG